MGTDMVVVMVMIQVVVWGVREGRALSTDGWWLVTGVGGDSGEWWGW